MLQSCSVCSRPGSLLDLLVLTPNGKPVDVHRDGDHYFWVPYGFSRSVVDVSGLNPFPFGPAVLEPDLDLDLAEFKCVRYLGALRQREVLFTVELFLKFKELFAGEGRPPPPALPRRTARG